MHGVQRADSSTVRASFALPLILVVDDVEDNRDLCALVLHGRGYTVRLAVDGADAVSQVRLHPPAVILMDLAMPTMDGFEAARQIRAMPALAEVRIIGVSAFTDSENVERALEAGCDEVLAKPLAPRVLLERVEANLRARTPRGARHGRMSA